MSDPVWALTLRLAGPLQSWGSDSRFNRRLTNMEPTKSGVLGMLAAAHGRHRTDDISDLAGLKFGVRVDQPGQVVRDFQTAIRPATGRAQAVQMPVSQRHYLADAVFVAVVSGSPTLIDALADAVTSPIHSMYLGRRSCPPEGRVLLSVGAATVASGLHDTPWQAATWWRRRQPRQVALPIVRDATSRETGTSHEHDVPVSFDPDRRRHGWRTTIRDQVVLDNPEGMGEIDPHDPMGTVMS